MSRIQSRGPSASARNKGRQQLIRHPRLDSFNGRVWSVLTTGAGHICSFPKDRYPSRHIGDAIEHLRNFYGLDIRPFYNPRGPQASKRLRYILVGETVGRAAYIDYITNPHLAPREPPVRAAQ